MPDEAPNTDKTAEVVVEVETPKVTQDNPEDTKEFWQAEAEKWKGFSRKHEKSFKEASEELEGFKTQIDSFKTVNDDLSKALDENESLKKGIFESTKKNIGLKHGLTPLQISKLSGKTEEELEADAIAVLEDLSNLKGVSKPRPNPTQGINSGDKTNIGDLARDHVNKYFNKQS